MSQLLEASNVTVRYRERSAGGTFDAVSGAGFSVAAGQMLGLVGESGCGKSSLGRALVGLVPLAAGEVRWQGRRIDALAANEFRPLRRALQFVFQDPHASFDPRMTIAESVAEPLRALLPGLRGAERGARVGALLDEVGLAPEHGARYPHQLSGGQLQRAAIARALVPGPQFVVCDEPVSALDVSVQGQIVNLFAGIQRDRGLAGLFISHNLAVVARLCGRVLVMYRGRIVESAASRDLIAAPLHPYTRELLDAVPVVEPGARRRVQSKPVARPAESAASVGCAFAARCPFAVARCRSEMPPLRSLGPGREVACHRANEWPGGLSPAVAG
ncbi:MAG: oligopeptide/dipeptide ABC transporter ATP-binding protein [Gammaproteobacteria bacterium]